MTWLISIFLGRIFDETVNILESYIQAMLDGTYTPKDAGMNFIAAELQMLINHAQCHKGDTKIWAFLSGVQSTIGTLDFEKK
jgi:hypothetical protein